MDEKIISKIKKLLALSKSENEHESQNAMLKVQEMLMKHKLELKDVEEYDIEPITTEEKEIVDSELNEIYNNFINAMNEDFNTSLALVEFNKINKIITNALSQNTIDIYPQINYFVNKLGREILGLQFTMQTNKNDDIPSEIKDLAEKRWNAKLNKDWALADNLRNEILEKGFVILDNPNGYKIEKK
jgi:cysteinyl-tRNA synthetase